jgi:hypothetical protein
LLRRLQAFFLKLIECRSKKRHTALRLPAIRRLRIAATISSSVKSGWSAINTSKKSACASRGEMLPPLGLGAILPVSCCRCIHLMAELGLTANHSAASRRDAPDAMASTTRSRNSKEHGFGIDPPPKIESVPPDSLIQTIPGNTDSTQVKSALTPDFDLNSKIQTSVGN